MCKRAREQNFKLGGALPPTNSPERLWTRPRLSSGESAISISTTDPPLCPTMPNGNLGLTRGEEVELLFPLFQPEAPSSYNKAKKTQNRRTRKVHPFLQRVQQEIRQHKSISHISKLFSGRLQLFSCQCFPPSVSVRVLFGLAVRWEPSLDCRRLIRGEKPSSSPPVCPHSIARQPPSLSKEGGGRETVKVVPRKGGKVLVVVVVFHPRPTDPAAEIPPPPLKKAQKGGVGT